ncbi:MAG: DeoR/GlpR family DNA-binding transcription regulator [Sphaerochaeta sp.]|jgi:DeoR family fructose operon transcriptional repressor|uniref:DeoR/GlpR family DNA-binding transcription regulator n=1 Tax=unclassified Sphaerochaeta TaxID=2637943 RepID=UPI000A73A7BA|nr:MULTISPECIES: DeoR/GlpR family DNA-binding transcription regulator [unclassified Sphaerochaeta]MCK9600637.1 DeoR/GlpR family DNA-binding transcription regulator [Sphaerochaeta sp.]MDX9825514.1 DeoR/GlpR family DNA-binding transcription regulator [Sphaerochaeta sp.]MEA4864810.1 DeoR/GlpR family DNA-binding transcription regulator [Sphaerochaeta sp.]HAP56625.1 DeoR/GlpR transcriptional regulator [Sphaerochaeta sp.]HBO36431.1 DeoR/GlpR transcriptional regulator [Sphaerochaeta sp.]
MSIIPASRQQYILSLIKTEGTVTVSQLAEELGVSELTIRRDLDQLEKKGLVERTHGGATARRNLPVEPDYLQKASEYPKEKEAIGQAVAAMVEEGDTLYINSGSTTFEVIRSVVALQKKVTIVTNNIDAIWLCKESEHIRLILAGGVYRSRSHSVSGSLSSILVNQVYANKAIIGVDGFSPSAGLTTPILEEAETTRAMIEHTVGTVIVVAAANKIGVVSNFKTVGLDQVDVLVTDEKGGEIVKQMEIPEGLAIQIATT